MREFALLEHVYAANRGLPAHVTIPPGDDMGALHIGGGEILVTVDQLADGVHVDLRTTPLEKVGRKALTRNLSDVAAMAARPVGAVVAACLPRDFGEARVNRMFDAMRATGERYGCPLFGGDVSMWDGRLLLSVTVLAEPLPGVRPVTRRGAKVGDAVCVTGSLGGSSLTVEGRTHHLDFEPRLNVAAVLATDKRWDLHCMIDLSDGLARDLGHLCRAAEDGPLGARLQAAALPVSAAAELAAKNDDIPTWRHALSDGEDYELCFTLPAEQAAALPRQIHGVPITRIGAIVAGGQAAGITIELPDGIEAPVGDWGWEHRGA